MLKFRVLFATLLLVASAALLPATATAGVRIQIDISSQTMDVIHNGQMIYSNWRISSAAGGSYTPRGNFGVRSLSRHHRSSRYNGAPMPHSIFFRGNYAIHGTIHEKQLGRPASHGCVRLSRANAARLFTLVEQVGSGNVSISIRN
jgi:lipoprotein-anchoring transpeptidase ErfK/SrfK